MVLVKEFNLQYRCDFRITKPGKFGKEQKELFLTYQEPETMTVDTGYLNC